MGDRRKAREAALMILYQADVARMPPDLALERFFASFEGGEPLDRAPPFADAGNERPPELTPQAKAYTERLVRGVWANLAELDAAIQKASSHWRIDRMARVDRNLLRIGAFEILFTEEEVPKKVAINEAVEIAKRFGAAESAAFVNGILDRLGKG